MNPKKKIKQLDKLQAFQLSEKQKEKTTGGFINYIKPHVSTEVVNLICYGNVNGVGERLF